MNYKQEILNIKDGQKWIWPESDYGKAEIWKINDIYILFGIPMYGGEPFFIKAYRLSDCQQMIDAVESWI